MIKEGLIFIGVMLVGVTMELAMILWPAALGLKHLLVGTSRYLWAVCVDLYDSYQFKQNNAKEISEASQANADFDREASRRNAIESAYDKGLIDDLERLNKKANQREYDL